MRGVTWMSSGETRKREFLSGADAYVRMQRNHMKAENKVVLPMADRLLTARDDASVVEAFERLDRTSPAAAKRLEERITALCQRLRVPGH